jgi:ubiquinone biosynthesis protein COQ4
MSGPDRPTWGFRLEPRAWPSLARQLRETPDDVTLGTRLFFSVGGHDESPTYRRFLRTTTGRRLVAQAVAYPPLFTDYDALRALEPGTLGREYVRQLDERQIHPLKLAELTGAAYRGRAFSAEHAYVRDRVRDAHDLVHTLTGYGIDVLGEAGALSFTFAQTGNKGWAALVLLNHLTALTKLRFDGWRVAGKAYWRGRRARYLPAVDDWDRLLRLPIDTARSELGITPMPHYRPLWLEEIFAVLAKSEG